MPSDYDAFAQTFFLTLVYV